MYSAGRARHRAGTQFVRCTKAFARLAEISDVKVYLEELGTAKVQDLCVAGNAIHDLDVRSMSAIWSTRRALPLLHMLGRSR